MNRLVSEIGEKKVAIDRLSNDTLSRIAPLKTDINRLAEGKSAFEKLKTLELAANDTKISNRDMAFRILLLFGLPLGLLFLMMPINNPNNLLIFFMSPFIIYFSKREYFNKAKEALFNKDARKKSAESIHLDMTNKFAPNKIQADIEGKKKEMLLLESSLAIEEQKLKQEMATIEQALNQLMVKYNLNV
ncbi:MAG: hypothetical protein HZA03_09925 [Nitrospinae bacterium]|nr:hypothetical protein [Nitrospinota bacterium]